MALLIAALFAVALAAAYLLGRVTTAAELELAMSETIRQRAVRVCAHTREVSR